MGSAKVVPSSPYLMVPVNFGSPFHNGLRHCDICDRAISNGERYFIVVVPREHVPSEADSPRNGLAVDALGNVRADMCRECRNGMGLTGDGRVD